MAPYVLPCSFAISAIFTFDANSSRSLSSSISVQGFPAFRFGICYVFFFSDVASNSVNSARMTSGELYTLSEGRSSPVVGSTPSANVLTISLALIMSILSPILRCYCLGVNSINQNSLCQIYWVNRFSRRYLL